MKQPSTASPRPRAKAKQARDLRAVLGSKKVRKVGGVVVVEAGHFAALSEAAARWERRVAALVESMEPEALEQLERDHAALGAKLGIDEAAE